MTLPPLPALLADPFFWLYLLMIQFVTYGLYWWDKRAAIRGERRTPEATLLMAGFLGGTIAALAAQMQLRHKTRKRSFQIRFWGMTLVQIGLIMWFFMRNGI